MKIFKGLYVPEYDEKSIRPIPPEINNDYFAISLAYCNSTDSYCFSNKITCNDCLFNNVYLFEEWHTNLIRENKLKRIIK